MTGPEVDRGALRDGLAALLAEQQPDLGARHEDGDEAAALELVVAAAALADESAGLLADAVAGARRQEIPWARIGAALGMTRQAAQQRFGVRPEPEPSDDDVWRLTPVTAFNEMEELERYGRQGWHSIGYGPLFHDLVRDSVQWEHRRVSVLRLRSSRLLADGWQVVGDGWFPWAYLARPTTRPAEDG